LGIVSAVRQTDTHCTGICACELEQGKPISITQLYFLALVRRPFFANLLTKTMSAARKGNDDHNSIDNSNNSSSCSNSNLAAASEILRAHDFNFDDLPDPECYYQWKDLRESTLLSIAHCVALKRYVTQLRAPQGNHSQRGNEENQENDRGTVRFQELAKEVQSVKEALKRIDDKDLTYFGKFYVICVR
jgi:hypothetical protein